MQTLVFNTTQREVKFYEGQRESSKLLDMITDVPTVRISESGYYEVMKKWREKKKTYPF